ncbi:hypothetical protein [Polyangium mundeleinium]|uniref:Uncharacterized protein n=1 Tax=Polyangium mundeleinium TaxID=2995306 RepID=A0ABT5EI34_9BACT|nr:hypothetical protein [Polyangium mundeleinium]MDC0741037.1 hypothetical protein [Polyangium mundeleinium]
MQIGLSKDINAEGCKKCQEFRPWWGTIAKIAAQLHAHGVIWPNFLIIHGKRLSCRDAPDAGRFDESVYVIATDEDGKDATAEQAKVFVTEKGNSSRYVAVSNVLNGSAFR